MKVSESGYTREELLEIVDTYLAEQSRRWEFIEEKGDGMYVYAENGDRYLDFFAGIAVSSAGNANKKVAKAIADQAANVIHASNYAYTLPMILLAKKVCDTIGMEKIVFQNSGTEANEAMIKMARKYGVDNYGPDRYKIVTAKNSFHGRTYGALSATGQPDSACHKGFAPLLPGFTYAEYNNLEDFKSKCDENTIGIMVEPVQGEGGVYPADPEFLKGLREFCDEKNMLLMFDEVQVGSGRTGKLFAHQNYGVEPDTCSMAKALGSGVPIGAVCARGDAAKTLTPGTHGSTFAGGPLACALAATTLDVMINEGVIENARVMGEYFRDQMHKVIEKNHPKAVNEIRGLGMINGIQLNHPSGQPVVDLCYKDANVLINNTNGNVLRFVPPLITGKEEIDLCIKAVDDAMTKLGW